jgi:arsenite oxidase small subunit
VKRREFVQLCTAAAACGAAPALSADRAARLHGRARLVDEKGQPIRVDALTQDVTYVFDYPFVATPCFLIRLDRPTPQSVELRTESGQPYRWDGGVGPQRSVVAYSAICAHKMTYPTKQVSFIGYRAQPSPVAPSGRVITCCSDRSVYDPSNGARVVSGPAPQPLAAVLLEHDARTNEVWAVGTYGGDKFDEFFRKYDFRLQLEVGPRARTAVDGNAVVRELTRYSNQWAQC